MLHVSDVTDTRRYKHDTTNTAESKCVPPYRQNINIRELKMY